MKVAIITYSDGQQCKTCEGSLGKYKALYGSFNASVTVIDEECECDKGMAGHDHWRAEEEAP